MTDRADPVDAGQRHLYDRLELAGKRLMTAAALYVRGGVALREMSLGQTDEHQRIRKMIKEGDGHLSALVVSDPLRPEARICTAHVLNVGWFLMETLPCGFRDLQLELDVERALQGGAPVRTTRSTWHALRPVVANLDWFKPTALPWSNHVLRREVAILSATEDFAKTLTLASMFRWHPGFVSKDKAVVVNAIVRAAGDLWMDAIAGRVEFSHTHLAAMTAPIPNVHDLLTFQPAADEPTAEPGDAEGR